MKYLLAAAGLVLLAGCATPAVDTADTSSIRKAGRGIVVLMADDGTRCHNAGVQIARRDGDFYMRDRRLQTRHLGNYKAGIVSEYDAGEYYVTTFHCAWGSEYGASVGQTSFIGLGKFRVEPGEFVNAGMLLVSRDASGRIVRKIQELPPDMHEMLRKEYPNLYPKMISRPMTFDESTLDVEMSREKAAIMGAGTGRLMIPITTFRRK